MERGFRSVIDSSLFLRKAVKIGQHGGNEFSVRGFLRSQRCRKQHEKMAHFSAASGQLVAGTDNK